MSYTKPVLVYGVGGTLTFAPAEPGVIASATVSIYRPGETTALVDAQAATVSGDTRSASYAVDAATCDTLARNYRAEWTITIGSVTLARTQTFEVKRRAAYVTLTHDRLVAYHPILADRGPDGADFSGPIAVTWGTLHALIRAKGKDPNDVPDPRALEEAHADLTAARIARNFAAGGPATSDWHAWAETTDRHGHDALDAAMANIEWIDLNEDGLADDSEEDFAGGRVRLSR